MFFLRTLFRNLLSLEIIVLKLWLPASLSGLLGLPVPELECAFSCHSAAAARPAPPDGALCSDRALWRAAPCSASPRPSFGRRGRGRGRGGVGGGGVSSGPGGGSRGAGSRWRRESCALAERPRPSASYGGPSSAASCPGSGEQRRPLREGPPRGGGCGVPVPGPRSGPVPMGQGHPPRPRSAEPRRAGTSAESEFFFGVFKVTAETAPGA